MLQHVSAVTSPAARRGGQSLDDGCRFDRPDLAAVAIAIANEPHSRWGCMCAMCHLISLLRRFGKCGVSEDVLWPFEVWRPAAWCSEDLGFDGRSEALPRLGLPTGIARGPREKRMCESICPRSAQQRSQFNPSLPLFVRPTQTVSGTFPHIHCNEENFAPSRC
jgi:hypothetical protein